MCIFLTWKDVNGVRLILKDDKYNLSFLLFFDKFIRFFVLLYYIPRICKKTRMFGIHVCNKLNRANNANKVMGSSGLVTNKIEGE